VPASHGLAACYERMREQVLYGGDPRSVGITLVLRQGLWAWMMLAAPENEGSDASRGAPGPTPTPPSPVVTVCSELLAAWTDLVVGAVRRQEAS